MKNISKIFEELQNSSQANISALKSSRSQNNDNHIVYDELLTSAVATVGPLGAGVLIFEAALVPGILMGIAAIAVSKRTTDVKYTLYPIVKSTIRSLQSTGQHAKELIAETQERMEDILAEIDADQEYYSRSKIISSGPVL